MTTLPHPNTACLRCASQPTGEGIAKLRELAQAATPGPWSHSDGKLTPDKIWIYGGEHRVRLALAEWGLDFGQDIQATTMANAAFIAAANPAAILSLLDRLEHAEKTRNFHYGNLTQTQKERNELRKALTTLQQRAEVAEGCLIAEQEAREQAEAHTAALETLLCRCKPHVAFRIRANEVSGSAISGENFRYDRELFAGIEALLSSTATAPAAHGRWAPPSLDAESAAIYAMADVALQSPYVNGPDASVVLTLARHMWGAAMEAIKSAMATASQDTQQGDKWK